MTTIKIRAYRDADRSAVRDICYRTGYMGDPISSQWADQPSFANLFTGYYTDDEPESALVAERDDVVIGYLLGCRDTAQSTSATRLFFDQLATRCIAFRPGTARFVRRALADSVTDLFHRVAPPDRLIDPRWPAHLHIDLLPEARGQGVGRNLVQQWLQRLEVDGIAGCHLETLAENNGAISFFRSCGFEYFGPAKLAPALRAPDGTRHHIQVMVRSLEPDPRPGTRT